MNVEKDYYTIPEAAKICSVGRTTMWRWVKSGYLKASMTLGGQHRIQKTELESVLAERGGVFPALARYSAGTGIFREVPFFGEDPHRRR